MKALACCTGELGKPPLLELEQLCSLLPLAGTPPGAPVMSSSVPFVLIVNTGPFSVTGVIVIFSYL